MVGMLETKGYKGEHEWCQWCSAWVGIGQGEQGEGLARAGFGSGVQRGSRGHNALVQTVAFELN